MKQNLSAEPSTEHIFPVFINAQLFKPLSIQKPKRLLKRSPSIITTVDVQHLGRAFSAQLVLQFRGEIDNDLIYKNLIRKALRPLNPEDYNLNVQQSIRASRELISKLNENVTTMFFI